MPCSANCPRSRSQLQCALRIVFFVHVLTSSLAVRADAECARPHIRWRSGVSLHWQRALLAACDELASASGLDASIEPPPAAEAVHRIFRVGRGWNRTLLGRPAYSRSAAR